MICLIETTGTEIVRYDDISNSITRKNLTIIFISNIFFFIYLTRQIEHSEYLWHMLNDNKFPKKQIFSIYKNFVFTNFLLALILCHKLRLNIFARLRIFIFTLIFRETFSINNKIKFVNFE
jgi:hypothetical protein